jgi:hypothetical protein
MAIGKTGEGWGFKALIFTFALAIHTWHGFCWTLNDAIFGDVGNFNPTNQARDARRI